MTGRLASKVVVVTGGGTGIGRAVAGQAVADGAAVVIGGRRKDVGERAATELRGSGGRALFVASDVTVEADVARTAPARPALPAGGKLVQRPGRASRWLCRTPARRSSDAHP